MIMDAWLIWLIAASVFLIIEVLSQTMWTLCLVGGCVVSMIVALCGFSIEAQLVFVVIGTLLSYLLLIPAFRKRGLMKQKTEDARTGMDALLGRRAFVTKEIKPGELGRARIDGDNWQVKAPGVNHVIPRGAEVVVTSYDSIILDVAVIG